MVLYTGTGTQIPLSDTSAALSTPWDDVLHRGWHEGVPDNTLPAYYLVKENGYSWGECDIRLSADGIPVLWHDSTVTGLRDGVSTTLTIAQSNASDITALVLKTHAQFGDIHPCTLEQLLDLAKTIGIGIVIDVKSAGNMTTEEGNKILARTVVASGWADHVIYMPLGTGAAKWIQEIDRNASFDFVSGITTVDKLPADFSGYTALLTGSNTVGFDFGAYAGMDKEIFTKVHDAGLSVSFWNVNNTEWFQYGPLRVTYNGYGNAHLGRDYHRQKQAELDTKYGSN